MMKSCLLISVRAVGALLAALVLASCAAPGAAPNAGATLATVHVPKQLSFDGRTQGLVVGVLAGSALASNYHERLWFLRAVVKINGVSYVGAVNDGFLVLPLAAGDYELQFVETQKNVSDKSLTAYPVNYKFRVQAGRATSLGLVAFTRAVGEGKFQRAVIDNSEEITARLRREQKAIFDALDPRAPIVAADAAYAQAPAIEQLRREIARDAFTRTDSDTGVSYAFGEVGTIAKAVRDSQQRVMGFEALATGTTARMFSCAGEGERFVCSSDEPALYRVRATKVDRIALPAFSGRWWVEAFAPAGIVLVDENMSIFRSGDDGRTWTRDSWFAAKQPLASTVRIRAYNGKSGFYLYSIDKIDPLAPVALFSPYGGGGYRRIDVPDLPVWDKLIEVGDALAVGPAFSNVKERSLIYLRPLASDRWEERQLPDINCLGLQRVDDGDITVLCSRKRYRSHDLGRTWTPDESRSATASLN
jgi:hypothetical protein